MPSLPQAGDAHALADVEVDIVVARPAAARRRARRATPVPERGRAAADERGNAELKRLRQAEVRRQRAGGQAERDHQQVEGSGGELGGDGDAGGDPPHACIGEIHRRLPSATHGASVGARRVRSVTSAQRIERGPRPYTARFPNRLAEGRRC